MVVAAGGGGGDTGDNNHNQDESGTNRMDMDVEAPNLESAIPESMQQLLQPVVSTEEASPAKLDQPSGTQDEPKANREQEKEGYQASKEAETVQAEQQEKQRTKQKEEEKVEPRHKSPDEHPEERESPVANRMDVEPSPIHDLEEPNLASETKQQILKPVVSTDEASPAKVDPATNEEPAETQEQEQEQDEPKARGAKEEDQEQKEQAKSLQENEQVPAKEKEESEAQHEEENTVKPKEENTAKPREESPEESPQESLQETESDEDGKTPLTLEHVYDALDSLDSEGSTCTGGVATELPAAPGLLVEGVGDISVPLDPYNADKLKAAAQQAPHGRGMETIVDTSVRNTLQIDANKVTLTNPAWPAALQALTSKVCTALGVPPDLVRTELYKLLLYEPGGFFKKHRDTEKADGMFATLVIQLPSRFTGGSFVVTHNGKTETFAMHEPKTSPYSCRYVAHYADCEHEIMPIESGHRLALIYSLCYTGNQVSKPSVATLANGGLVSVLEQLDPSESLFAVPMDHQYTTASLTRLGVGALKGSDRALAKTISRAQGWELVIAKLERIDYERGGGCPHIDYADFEVCDTEPGYVSFKELFHQDGSDAEALSRWFNREIQLEAFDEGGNLLAEVDYVRKELWGLEHSTEPQYTGNEGVARETTYGTCILIAFSSDGVFERECRYHFSSAVEKVQSKPHLLDRALKFIAQSNPTLSSGDFVILHTLIKGRSSFWSSFNTILQGLSKNQSQSPSSKVISILASMIREYGWKDEKIVPVHLFLENLPDIGNKVNCMGFLTLLEHFLSIKKVVEDKSSLESLIQKTIRIFSTTTQRHPHESEEEIFRRIGTLSTAYGWESLSPAANVCFVKMRQWSTTASVVTVLANQIAAVKNFSTKFPLADIANLRGSILNAFLGVVRLPQVWASSAVRLVVNELFLYGTPQMFHRLESWASLAPLSILSTASKTLQSLSSTNSTCMHAEAKNKCVAHIQKVVRDMKVAELKKQENDLLRLTRGGPPVFSWRMPQAKSGSRPLDVFLWSDREAGEICVGGGIGHARSLARSAGSNSRGYSAHIRASHTTGKNASVIVRKTKELHQAHFTQYESNANKLAIVRIKLEKLNHRRLPSALEEPPAKRAKGPNDQEVIVID